MKNEAVNIYEIRNEKCEVQYPFITIGDITISNHLKNILPENQHNIVYSGALGEKQNPHELLEVFNFISNKFCPISCGNKTSNRNQIFLDCRMSSYR